MENKKGIEFNFITFIIIMILMLALVFVVARSTGKETVSQTNENVEEQSKQEKIEDENKPVKLYSYNVISLDENKLTENWEIKEEGYGEIAFFIQGPKINNEDGTISDIRINIYIQESEMTNADLKTQMLEHSIYSKIEYTKMQEINKIQWMEFEAENKGIKAKILTIMKDGYMYAVEINGEESLYDEYYNEAMKIVMTVQIAERITKEQAESVIFDYDTLANIKVGSTQYLLTSLDLPITMEEIEIPEEYQDYKFTGISYKDFVEKMKTYMTEDVIKNQFSEFIEYKDNLLIKEYMIEEVNPIFIKGNETTYEVVKTNMNTFVESKEKITLKLEGEQCIVSNVEYID